MFSQYLEGVEGIDTIAIATTIFFIIMFIAVVIWIFTLDKKYIKKMENLPLE